MQSKLINLWNALHYISAEYFWGIFLANICDENSTFWFISNKIKGCGQHSTLVPPVVLHWVPLTKWTYEEGMQEQMESMVKAQHFSCINLKLGFWHVKMAEDSHQFSSAFTVGSMGMYEFLWMPFGLCNALATFQHLMKSTWVNWTWPMLWSTSMMSSFSLTHQRNISSNFEQCWNASWSTDSNSNHQSTASFVAKLIT